MKNRYTENLPTLATLAALVLLASCNTLEQASRHGFDSGHYRMDDDQEKGRKVYVDLTEESLHLHALTPDGVDPVPFRSVSMEQADSLPRGGLAFRKQSLDIDITAILMKYRPAVAGLPGQLSTDFNAALYAGWRHDHYRIRPVTDPLGRRRQTLSGWGYDLGVFGGVGTTPVGPSTTRDRRLEDYSGMVLQAGVAGFMESNLASFGLAIGLDHLLGPDRRIWIHQHRPWVGLIVGVALN